MINTSQSSDEAKQMQKYNKNTTKFSQQNPFWSVMMLAGHHWTAATQHTTAESFLPARNNHLQETK